MNDFTKEELNILHEFLDTACELYSEPDSTYSLRDKIQTMIDNYCEHEGSEPKLVLVKNCVKCNSHLETRPWGPE